MASAAVRQAGLSNSTAHIISTEAMAQRWLGVWKPQWHSASAASRRISSYTGRSAAAWARASSAAYSSPASTFFRYTYAGISRLAQKAVSGPE